MTTTPFWKNDHGGTAVEFVLLTPLVVLLFGFLPIQLGIGWHEKHLLTAAAHEASHAASQALPTEREKVANEITTNFLANSSLLSNAQVSNVTASEDTISVALSASGVTVIPGITITIRAEAVSYNERFVPGARG